MRMISRTLIMLGMTLSISAHDGTDHTNLPIVLHGPYTMEKTVALIRKYVGNKVYVKNIVPLKHGANMFAQAEHFRKEVEVDPALRNGFDVITHAHSGLVVRYYIERYNNPAVHTYIAYGTPEQGVFGMPGTLDDHFQWLDALEERAHHILYSWSFQQYIPFASYWHDTLHHDAYLKYASLLPYLNNEIDHEYAGLFKYNLCRLHAMVLICSQYEHTIEPAISCHFGFYKQGSKTEIEEMRQTKLYNQDLLGLKTLDLAGKLHLKFASCPHENFPEDEENFTQNVLPALHDAHPVAPGRSLVNQGVQ